MGDGIVPVTAPWESVTATGAGVVVATSVGTAMIPHLEPTTFVGVKTAADFLVVWAKSWSDTVQAPPLDNK